VNIDQMRLYVMQAYPGPKWAQRVSKMANNQIVAVYNNILAREAEKSAKEKLRQESDDRYQYRQMTLWEVFDI